MSLLVLLSLIGTGLFWLTNELIRQIIQLIKNIPIYVDMIADKLDHLCKDGDKMFGLTDGHMKKLVDDNMDQVISRIKTNVMPKITEHTLNLAIWVIGLVSVLLIIFIAAVLIVKDLPGFIERYKDSSFYKELNKITSKLSNAGMGYLRAQLIIMSMIAILSTFGLSILKNPYALLIGIGIALMDALPILGSGLVYIPWSIIMLLSGNIYAAAILITTYLVCQIIREILEPKLIGNRIGIKPLFTLISMYIGVKLFSVAGFILGPIGLIIIITIVKAVNEKDQEEKAEETA